MKRSRLAEEQLTGLAGEHQAGTPGASRTGRLRRGGRAAYGARLERVYTGDRIEGSNPSLSAIFPDQPVIARQCRRASDAKSPVLKCNRYILNPLNLLPTPFPSSVVLSLPP